MSQKSASWGAYVLLSAVIVILLGILVPWHDLMNPRPTKAVITMCASNLKMIGMAMEMYCSDWGDRRPPLYMTDQRVPKGKAWPDLLMPYVKKLHHPHSRVAPANLFRCPDSAGDRLNYSLNPWTAGLAQVKVKYPATTIAVFDSVSDSPENNNLNSFVAWQESDLGVPPVGSLVIWPERERFLVPKLPSWARPRHRSRTNILWADGHVSCISMGNVPSPEPQFDPTKKPEP